MGDWKVVLMEQRAKTLRAGSSRSCKLRAPKIFNLRRDPFERADENSNTYWDWVLSHALHASMGCRRWWREQIEDFVKFPPRQKPASFNLDAVMRTTRGRRDQRHHLTPVLARFPGGLPPPGGVEDDDRHRRRDDALLDEPPVASARSPGPPRSASRHSPRSGTGRGSPRRSPGPPRAASGAADSSGITWFLLLHGLEDRDPGPVRFGCTGHAVVRPPSDLGISCTLGRGR